MMVLALLALAQDVIPLYPGPAPGTELWNWPETVLSSPDGLKRIANVTRPTLTVYRPARPNGTAIVVAPGGGFRHLAIEHEGSDAALWLNSIGVTAFVLKYRTFRSGEGAEGDLQKLRAGVIPFASADGRAAIALVRRRAAEWDVRANRVGIMGFSAGGWVAAAAALEHDPASRPDFAIPVYGAMPQNAQAPAAPMPLMLVHANDDKTVDALETSVRLYGLWKKAGAPVELHIYSSGGHGFGMKKTGLPSATWTDRVRDWLGVQGLLK
jgi:acetyl esterase/lipase